MLYGKKFELTANSPQQFSTINMSSSRQHFLQIMDESAVTVRVTLDVGGSFVEIETVTGPGIFKIEVSPQQFELVSNMDTVVVLSGN